MRSFLHRSSYLFTSGMMLAVLAFSLFFTRAAAAGSFTATGSTSTDHASGTLTLLTNGKVLIAGGSLDETVTELYDSTKLTWTNTGSLNIGRFSQTATLLPDGRVLVAGGGTNG